MTAVPEPPSAYDRPRVVPDSLEGLDVVVLGGSSGFGRQVALDSARCGARVTVVGRDPAKAHATSSEAAGLGGHATAIAVDLSTQAGRDRLLSALGEVDHVVSTLGDSLPDGDEDAPMDDAALRAILHRKVADDRAILDALAPRVRAGGSIVLTAGSTRGDGGEIETLVREAALALAPRVRVNAVAPTWTQTPLWRRHDDAAVVRRRHQMEHEIPLGRIGEVTEVAQAYLFLMTCGFVTGQTIAVDGGYALT